MCWCAVKKPLAEKTSGKSADYFFHHTLYSSRVSFLLQLRRHPWTFGWHTGSLTGWQDCISVNTCIHTASCQQSILSANWFVSETSSYRRNSLYSLQFAWMFFASIMKMCHLFHHVTNRCYSRTKWHTKHSVCQPVCRRQEYDNW